MKRCSNLLYILRYKLAQMWEHIKKRLDKLKEIQLRHYNSDAINQQDIVNFCSVPRDTKEIL